MTPVQISASEKDEEKLRRSGVLWEGDWREGDVTRAEAGWSPQHPLLVLQ